MPDPSQISEKCRSRGFYLFSGGSLAVALFFEFAEYFCVVHAIITTTAPWLVNKAKLEAVKNTTLFLRFCVKRQKLETYPNNLWTF
jgi:hypothetical protein